MRMTDGPDSPPFRCAPHGAAAVANRRLHAQHALRCEPTLQRLDDPAPERALASS
jgi:hypothetical protein